MLLSTVTKAPQWSLVTNNKINGPLGMNVVLHRQFIIILPLYALNNKNTPWNMWFRRGSQSVNIAKQRAETIDEIV